MKTQQEIFDIAATHLLRQNSKSARHSSNSHSVACLYRGRGDLKCAIGIFIPDDLYDKDMEQKDVNVLFQEFPEALAACGLDVSEKKLLRGLQSIHDQHPVREWRARLSQLARRLKLDDGVLS